MTINSAAAAEFDFSRPFEVDSGRAAVIAEWLRRPGQLSATMAFCAASSMTAQRWPRTRLSWR
jgi:hypothetical protein